MEESMNNDDDNDDMLEASSEGSQLFVYEKFIISKECVDVKGGRGYCSYSR